MFSTNATQQHQQWILRMAMATNSEPPHTFIPSGVSGLSHPALTPQLGPNALQRATS